MIGGFLVHRVLIVALLALSGYNSDAPARFAFTDVDPTKEFVIELSDRAMIAHARRIISREETAAVHVKGTIIKEPAPYNPGWSYHLDSGTIDFFEFAIEVCDSTMQYVEDHLSTVGGAFLPDSVWCPWSSTLRREL
jgi:hypothetical protein